MSLAGNEKETSGSTECLLESSDNDAPTIEQNDLSVDRKSQAQNMSGLNEDLKKKDKELACMQAQLLQQEKMAAIGVLAAGVAHEINNPIGFINSNLGSLQKYVENITQYVERMKQEFNKGELSPEAISEIKALEKKLKIDFIISDLKNLVQESLEGTERVRKIVLDLKSFSRADDDKPKATNINEGIQSTLNIVWHELKYKVTMDLNYGDIPRIICYPQQLNQVFMNILVNAAQAIPEKGTVSIRTKLADEMIIVEIEDTGTGIPPKNIPRLFEPFFTTKEVGKGSGLGLSIAYEIIVKHKGKIEVESEIGKGTCFRIILPSSLSEEDLAPDKKK